MDSSRNIFPAQGGSLSDDRESWSVGADPGCRIRIQTAPALAAEIIRRGDRLFVRDLRNGAAIFVNQSSVPAGAEMELTRFDHLQIANTTIDISSELFVGRQGLALETSRLDFAPSGAAGRKLCDGVFLRARPGTFTGILGPVGSGKTVFLNLLNGYLTPAAGRVIVGQRWDLHRDFESVRQHIGFVPQDDVMIPELTVRQSLHYRLQLRFPGMTADVRDRLIEETCLKMGFDQADRRAKFLDTAVGSPDSLSHRLSGGQRKCANIALELVARPTILLLDEPTSGLSSADSDLILHTLHQLAVREHLTIVATIHQPSHHGFACLDDLLVLVHGGRIAYYGSAPDAVHYFEQATENPCPPKTSPAEYLLQQVIETRDADRLVRYMGKHPEGLPAPLAEFPDSAASSAAPGREVGRRLAESWRQAGVLIRRNLQVFRADRPNFRLAFGQIPLIALLMWLAFFNLQADGPAEERFSRNLYHDFHQPSDSSSAHNKAEEESTMISQHAALRRGGVLFVLVAAAIWFGCLGACREIVAEKRVLHRESRVCVRLFPYLGAKFLVQAGNTTVQCFLLAVLTVPFLLQFGFLSTLATWLILSLAAMTAVALGLLVSSLARSVRQALSAVPLLMLPQLLFGGMIRPQADIPDGNWLPRIPSFLTIQRWAFEPALAVDRYACSGVMVQCYPDAATPANLPMADTFRVSDGSLLQCFFTALSPVAVLVLPLLSLLAGSLLFLLACYWCLRREYSP